MTTINRLNNIIVTAKSQVSYAAVDDAAQQVASSYLENNLTNIGLDNGQDLAGFVSLTSQTDYPDQDIILGDSLARYSGQSLIDNVAIAGATIDIQTTTIDYDNQTDNVNGADPVFNDQVVSQNLQQIMITNTGSVPQTINLHRIVSTGSMHSIQDVLQSIDGYYGSSPSSVGLVNRTVVTNQDVQDAQQICSPIL